MLATIKNVQVLSARPLEPRAPEPGREAKKPQCEVKVLVDGPRGPEMKNLKAPFGDLADFLKNVGQTIEEIQIDINEWEINGRKGVSYLVDDGSAK